MLKTKSSQKGFTIVELLIVIVVIGILAALVLNTFAGVQKRARDTQRQTDINSVATQLEVYYNDNGGYPSVASLQSATWVPGNLKGIDAGALIAPGMAGNSIVGTTAANKDQYGYVPVPSLCVSPTIDNGDPNSGTFCQGFTISWWSEKEGAVKSKDSLNN